MGEVTLYSNVTDTHTKPLKNILHRASLAALNLDNMVSPNGFHRFLGVLSLGDFEPGCPEVGV